MVFTKNIAAIAAAAGSLVSAAPLQATSNLSKRGFNAGGSNNVAVWVGNSASTTKDTVTNACKDASVDIVILTFATAIAGDKVTVLHSGASDEEYVSEIKACQAAGKKVFMSLGGATGTISWTSAEQAKQGADAVYKQFLSADGMYKTALDGIDLDIEDGKSAFWTDFTKELASKKSKSQYISGAPQCPSPDASLPFDVLNQMDFVWVQFYNNGPCNHGASGFMDSVKSWSSKLTGPKLYIAAPGDKASAGSGYIDAGAMASEIAQVKGAIKNLGGYALWDYDTAAKNSNYQQAIKKALGGSTGGSDAPPASPSAGSSKTSPAAGPSKTAPAAGPTGTGKETGTTPVASPSKHDGGSAPSATGGETVKATSTVHVTSTKHVPTGTGSAPSKPTGTGSAPSKPSGTGSAPSKPSGTGAAPSKPSGTGIPSYGSGSGTGAAPSKPSGTGIPSYGSGSGSGSGSSTGGADTKTCSSAGTIVCSADGTSFGICDGANAQMMAVSAGTVCQGGNIVAADAGDASASTPTSDAAPAASSGAASSDSTDGSTDSTDSSDSTDDSADADDSE